MTDQDIEREIQAKGLTAARVTPQAIEDAIVAEQYLCPADALAERPGSSSCMIKLRDQVPGDLNTVNLSLNLLTICVLVLRNGFTVVGTSACASPENFDLELGRKIARQKAVDQVWPLMGYALRERLAAA